MPPPLPESEWDRRRAVAATCTSVDELSHKLNLESRMSTAMLQKHGCFVLCPICRRAPARELVTLRQHDITGAEPQPRFANQPGRRWVCASCAKALPTMPAKSHTVSVPEVRKAKVKAAKATGYSPRTLEKVQVVREASEKDPLRRV